MGADDRPPTSRVGRLRSGRLEAWELHRCHEPGGLCPLRTLSAFDEAAMESRLRCLNLRTQDAVIEWLGVCEAHSDDMMTLRAVLREEVLTPSRTGNRQVIEHVATMVARRELCLVVSAPVVRFPVFDTVRREPARAGGMTPSQLRPRGDESPILPPIDIGDFANVDHLQQAAALLGAARSAAPFCAH